ncbi:SDR family NAD(P)-dependent oxidoreductase [Curvivirga sp.]|uniref:SDR family NAD(P)-dependent oxidoreductase n=1 Tax=Curvivirga sp. TaxID=2856848 RepID=UPI003B5BE8B1
MPNKKLHALITGGSGAIGSHLAYALVAEGYHVTVAGRDEESLKRVANNNPHISYQISDVTDPIETASLVAKTLPLDIAILNAGAYQPGMTSQTTIDTFQHMMNVNFFGVVNCLPPLINHMKQHGGHIAIVGSLAGYVGLPNASGYGASKAAVVNLCESLQAELQGSPVKIQLISPGFVKSKLTDKNDFHMPDLLEPEEAAQFIIKGLKSDKFEIAFPRRFCRKIKLLQLLPYKAYFSLIKKVVG